MANPSAIRAWHLFAAFDTRSGKVYGRTAERKRQVEFIAFLEQLERFTDGEQNRFAVG
jgi:hypothetical protein